MATNKSGYAYAEGMKPTAAANVYFIEARLKAVAGIQKIGQADPDPTLHALGLLAMGFEHISTSLRATYLKLEQVEAKLDALTRRP